MAKIDASANAPWWTLYVEIEGQLDGKPRHGYFFDHPKELVVERFLAARYPDLGETAQAATEPRRPHRGYLVLGPETKGFIDETRKDEFWWVIPGKGAQEKIVTYYRGDRGIMAMPHFEQMLIEFFGAAGPPGGYGDGSFNREVAMDDFKVVRSVAVDELAGTAAIDDGTVAEINQCKPQPR